MDVTEGYIDFVPMSRSIGLFALSVFFQWAVLGCRVWWGIGFQIYSIYIQKPMGGDIRAQWASQDVWPGHNRLGPADMGQGLVESGYVMQETMHGPTILRESEGKTDTFA